MANRLNRLLGCGAVVGIATGRGDSVAGGIQQPIEKRHWSCYDHRAQIGGADKVDVGIPYVESVTYLEPGDTVDVRDCFLLAVDTRGLGRMTCHDLILRPAVNHAVCVGAGFVAADIVLGRTGEFAAAGGSCGNVMAILAWLGWKSYPVVRLGKDWAGDVIRNEFKSIGLEDAFLSDEAVVATPIVIQRFGEDKIGRRVHQFSRSCPECGGGLPRFCASTLEQATALAQSALAPKAFYMDRLSPAALKLAVWARDKGALVVYEPSSVGDEDEFQKAVDLCHILKYSHDRLGHLRDLRAAQQPRIIVETLAEEGLRVRWRGHWSELPAFALPVVVDGAGAGDWTTAGLVHKLGQGGSRVLEELQKPKLLSALRFGQGLAAVNCGVEGARGTMMAMTRDQLGKRLIALASGTPEPETDLGGTVAAMSNIPTRLCAACIG